MHHRVLSLRAGSAAMELAFVLALLATIHCVGASNATLTTVTCEGSPCAGDTLHLAFKLSGTPSGTPARSVGFYRNGEGNTALCTVDRFEPCNSSASCGCTETGGERIYHYKISSANSSLHDGAWTAAIQNNNPPDTVRSPVCQVSVNNSCPYLTIDQCPAKVEIGSSLHLSCTRRRQLPASAGTALRFVVNGTATVGTVDISKCTANTLPSGCFDRDGHTVYYLNVTANRSHDGDWTAVVNASPDSDTVGSDMCHVNVYVGASKATLVTFICDGSPCAGDTLHLAFKASGTPLGTPARSVGFYRNGEENAPLCLVDRIDPCDSSASCGCIETGGERTYHFNISSAASSLQDGNWTAVIQNNNPPDTVRSPVCQVSVNNSCPNLAIDQCPSQVAIGSSLYLACTMRRQLPGTAGKALRFVVDGTVTVATVNLATCTANTLPSGCFYRDGKTFYYLEVTADRSHDGDWTAVVDANSSSDTVRSAVCHVDVYDAVVIETTRVLGGTLGMLALTYYVILLLMIYCPKISGIKSSKKAIVAFVGALILLPFYLAVIVYNFATYKDDIKLFENQHLGNILVAVGEIIILFFGLVYGVVQKRLSTKYK